VSERRAELGLGAARFGPDPAGADPRDRASEEAVRATLETAAADRVSLIDTAPAWGDAERLLCRSWPFPSPFRVCVRTIAAAEGLDRVEARARRSLERMGLARGWALVVEAEDLLGPDGRALWDRMRRLKDEGLYQRIGVAAAFGDEPVMLAKRFKPDLMQLPVSVLDQRLVRDGTLETLAGLGIDPHLHSIFAQGLLFASREALPPALAHAGPRLSRVRRALAEAGADPLQAALGFALSRPEAAAVIVGVTSAAELRAVLAASNAPPPRLDWSALALDDAAALDPRPARLSSAA